MGDRSERLGEQPGKLVVHQPETSNGVVAHQTLHVAGPPGEGMAIKHRDCAPKIRGGHLTQNGRRLVGGAHSRGELTAPEPRHSATPESGSIRAASSAKTRLRSERPHLPH
jgi:hypothetical protein